MESHAAHGGVEVLGFVIARRSEPIPHPGEPRNQQLDVVAHPPHRLGGNILRIGKVNFVANGFAESVSSFQTLDPVAGLVPIQEWVRRHASG